MIYSLWFSTEGRAVLVARLLILGILFLTVYLALRGAVVAKLAIIGVSFFGHLYYVFFVNPTIFFFVCVCVCVVLL